jgi:choline kinase
VSIASADDTIPSSNSVYKDAESDGEGFSLDRPIAKSLRRHSVTRRIKGKTSVEKLTKARTPAELLKLRSGSSTSSLNLNQREHQEASQSINTIQHLLSHGFPSMEPAGDSPLAGDEPLERSRSSHRHPRLSYHDLIRWIQKEKARRAAAKSRKKTGAEESTEEPAPNTTPSGESNALSTQAGKNAAHEKQKSDKGPSADDTEEGSYKRRDSDDSTGSHALDMLHEILEQQLAFSERPASLRSNRSSKTSLFKKLRRQASVNGASSDTDFGESSVPTCEATLDNSKTLSYNYGAIEDENRPHLSRGISSREKDAWKTFKYEIVRLAHTLKLKGWRRVSLDHSDSIGVERLSGALTNAVYVVNPPTQMPEDDQAGELPKRHRPQKLLLRIYGSQVDHLIDRESELQILRRLARKRIGPRMLGTFTNGRFEEFLNAVPLTAESMRERGFSRQIAKRMRELHDGIELLETEVEAGPFVWQNIDKWIGRAASVVKTLEAANKRMMLEKGIKYDPADEHLLGCDFELFQTALAKYRKWLEDEYEGLPGIRKRLVFAHNDVSFGIYTV